MTCYLFLTFHSEMVDSAHDPLEIEELYVMQTLQTNFPSNYDVLEK